MQACTDSLHLCVCVCVCVCTCTCTCVYLCIMHLFHGLYSDNGRTVWRWVGTVTRFGYPGPQLVGLAAGLPAGDHVYALYLPLRNTLFSGQIGVPTGASLQPDSMYKPLKPVVWYGTSICQGGVASRAGTTYTNIISRQLSTGNEIWNFGFAGNGRMEVSTKQHLH